MRTMPWLWDRWLVVKGSLDGSADKLWAMYKSRIADLESEVKRRDAVIAEQNARHDFDMLLLDNAAAQVHAFAADNAAKAEEIVRLYSELTEARKTGEDLKAAHAAAVKAEAEMLVSCQKHRNRLAAIADAANQPIDCDSAKPERVSISLALSGGCVKCPTPGCRWTFYGSNCPGCGIRHPGIAVPDAANKPID